MMRIVFLVLLVLGLIWWFGRGGGRPAGPAPPPNPPGPDPQAMVRCAHCGLHLPLSDAVRDEAATGDEPARLYCGEAHRLLGPLEEPRA